MLFRSNDTATTEIYTTTALFPYTTLFRSPPSGVVLDCLTLWLSDRFDRDDETILAAWDAQLRGIREAPWPTVVVGNEIGWSPVPESAPLRRFRDLAGWLAQRTAAAADEAWLLVAGCPVRLK